MRVNMDATGTGKVAAHLEEAARRAIDPTPAFQEVTTLFIVAEQRRFKGRLAPLKPATVQGKQRSRNASTRANASQPLVATGALERALTSRGAGGQPVKLTRSELLLGIPGGRHDLHYVRYQKRYKRDPLVSRGIIRKAALIALSKHVSP